MPYKQRPVINPFTVLRCKVCANHTDVRCSGCQKPICRLHNAAPSHSFDLYCSECRYALVAARKDVRS
jgi:hypothetical protein